MRRRQVAVRLVRVQGRGVHGQGPGAARREHTLRQLLRAVPQRRDRRCQARRQGQLPLRLWTCGQQPRQITLTHALALNLPSPSPEPNPNAPNQPSQTLTALPAGAFATSAGLGGHRRNCKLQAASTCPVVGASPVGSERASANSPTPVAFGTSVDIDDQAPYSAASPSPLPLPSFAEPSEDIPLAAEGMPDPD